MAHRFDPVAYEARQQAKRDYEAHKQANPSPNSVPVLTERVKLLAQVLGVA